MKSFTYTITDPVGLHARPTGILVKEAKKYASACTLHANGKSAELTKLIKLMGLGVTQGMTVEVQVDGPDEDTACAELEEFFKANF